MRPELVMKSIVPVVMAGVLGIYGLIIAVIISTGSEGLVRQHHSGHAAFVLYLKPVTFSLAVNQTADKAYYLYDGYAHLAGGLACGLAGLGAGMAIGIVGDAGVR